MIIAVANQKGGVAKSTTAINLSAGLALAGHKVLLIDTDPQNNSSLVFTHPEMEIELEKTLHSALIHFAPIATVTHQTRVDNLFVVPSHLRLSSLDLELAQAFDNRSERLKRALGDLPQQYDYIIIDNPPALGLLTINSLVACDRLLIPVSSGLFALTGLVQLQETMGMIRQTQLNPNLEILGVLHTKTDHTNVSKDVDRQLREHFGELVFETAIPRNVSLEEAHSRYTHIFDYAPNSSGAQAYKALAQEVVER